MKLLFRALIIGSFLLLNGCGYNDFQRYDETIKESWSEVLNQYQRRADLIPNLVKTVQGYASHEKEVFDQVTEARSKAGSIQLTPELVNDEAAMKKFQDSQAIVTSSLSRLLAVAENYPQLKADTGFRDLQSQLEGTENRITVARKRYIESIKEYNILVRSFPSNLTAKFFSYAPKANFSVENEKQISTPPSVDFGSK
jgi:LemA protein